MKKTLIIPALGVMLCTGLIAGGFSLADASDMKINICKMEGNTE